MVERKSEFPRDPLAIAVGDRIADIMKKRKMGKEELATAMGKSPAYVWRIIDARQNITLKVLGTLCIALDVSLSTLFKGVGVPGALNVPPSAAADD